MIKEKKKYGSLFLILSVIVYVFTVMLGKYSILTYLITFVMLILTLLLNNDLVRMSPAILLAAFYSYTVAIGPIILLYKGIRFDYNFHTIILGGLLCFAIGNGLSSHSEKRIRVRRGKSLFRVISVTREKALYILFFISLIASALFIIKNRGYLVGNMEDGRINAITGNGLLVYISQLPMFIIPMLYELYFQAKERGKEKKRLYILIIFTAISTITLLFSAFRAPVVTMYICMIVIYAQNKKINFSKIILYGIFALILVTLLGQLRSISSNGDARSFLNALLTSLYVNDINLGYVINTFPRRVPFQHGYTYFINLLMLKPGPDLDFTLWLKQQVGINFSGGGLTPTILGEFYMNFGRVSIYFGMFLLGIISVWIDRYLVSHKGSFLAAFYTWQFAHCVGGGIANVMITLILYTILYRLLLWFPTNKKV